MRLAMLVQRYFCAMLNKWLVYIFVFLSWTGAPSGVDGWGAWGDHETVLKGLEDVPYCYPSGVRNSDASWQSVSPHDNLIIGSADPLSGENVSMALAERASEGDLPQVGSGDATEQNETAAPQKQPQQGSSRQVRYRKVFVGKTSEGKNKYRLVPVIDSAPAAKGNDGARATSPKDASQSLQDSVKGHSPSALSSPKNPHGGGTPEEILREFVQTPEVFAANNAKRIKAKKAGKDREPDEKNDSSPDEGTDEEIEISDLQVQALAKARQGADEDDWGDFTFGDDDNDGEGEDEDDIPDPEVPAKPTGKHSGHKDGGGFHFSVGSSESEGEKKDGEEFHFSLGGSDKKEEGQEDAELGDLFSDSPSPPQGRKGRGHPGLAAQRGSAKRKMRTKRHRALPHPTTSDAPLKSSSEEEELDFGGDGGGLLAEGEETDKTEGLGGLGEDDSSSDDSSSDDSDDSFEAGDVAKMLGKAGGNLLGKLAGKKGNKHGKSTDKLKPPPGFEDIKTGDVRDMHKSSLPYRQETSEAAHERLENQRFEREKQRREARKQEVTLESLYKRIHEVSPAISYLGNGYDVVKGNPLGDPSMMADPGLRAPIIQFYYEQSAEGVTSDLQELQPLGAYCRPYVACKQSENMSEVVTMSDYVKELDVDAALYGGDAIGFNSFSASTGYQELAKKTANKQSKTYLLRTYCFRYELGLAHADSFQWNYTTSFREAIGMLPEEFEGSTDEAGCTAQRWREDRSCEECKSTNVKSWMDFINEFGTHYIVKLYAGGKKTNQITIKNSEAAKLQSRGVNVRSALKTSFGAASMGASMDTTNKDAAKESLSSIEYDSETIILGGRAPKNLNNPDSMADWSDSVEALPMPIKISVQPLQYLLEGPRREAFEKAYSFYSDAVGMSKADALAMAGDVKTVGEQLLTATEHFYAGDPPGFLVCPEHSRVVLGFVLKVNFWAGAGLETSNIKPCAAGKDKCDGFDVPVQSGDDVRIFALCGEPIEGLQQVVATGTRNKKGKLKRATAECPEDHVIVAGFALATAGGRVGPASTVFLSCRPGLESCTAVGNKDTTRSFVWIACVDKTMAGVQNLLSIATTGTVGTATRRVDDDGDVKVVCPDFSANVMGFMLELHYRMQNPGVRKRFTDCPDNATECDMTGAGVEEAGIVYHKDTHALMGYALCEKKDKVGIYIARRP